LAPQLKSGQKFRHYIVCPPAPGNLRTFVPVDTLSVGQPPLSLARTLPAEAEVELKSCYVDILQMLALRKQSGATRQFTFYCLS
jgi:hypothetical protein